MQAQASMSPGRRSTAAERWLLVGLALAVTLLNAFKPLAIDDAYYFLYAEHIAQRPLDPYGFLLWDTQPANNSLGPPVSLYWFAAAVRLFGPHPFLWKLWLFPFVLLFVVALHAVGRRFAAGREGLFVVFLVLSPVVLPNVNLMPDVPALALALAALTLFFRACDRGSPLGAAAAGAIAGVGMQTKYTAFVAPAAMALYAFRAARPGLGVLAVGAAGSVFVGWEALVAAKYGSSHFLNAVAAFREPISRKLLLVQPLFGCLGGLLALGLPLALAVLGAPRFVVGMAAAAAPALLAFLAIPDGPALEGLQRFTHLSPSQKLTAALFGALGVAVAAASVVVARELLATSRRCGATPFQRPWRSDDGFLIGWALLEVAGYFALSPYAAARRVMGVSVVAALLVCRLAARSTDRGPVLWRVAAVNAAYALLLFAADFGWYYGHQRLIVEAVGRCRQENPHGRVWHFIDPASADPEYEFHAHRLGTRRLSVAGTSASPAPGDWVLVIDAFGDHQRSDRTSQAAFRRHPAAARCAQDDAVEWRPPLPVRSQLQASNVPVTRWIEPPLRVVRYRVQQHRLAAATRDFK